jgi:hypothetical protein
MKAMSTCTSKQTIVLIVLVQRSAHSIIIDLDGPSVKTGNDPWSFRVEGNSW